MWRCVNEVTHSALFPEFVSTWGQFIWPPEEQCPFLYICMCQVLTYHIPRLLTRHYQDFLSFIRSPSSSSSGYFSPHCVWCSCYVSRNINCTHVNNTSCSAYVFQYKRMARSHLILDVNCAVNNSNDNRQVCRTACASLRQCVNECGRHFDYFYIVKKYSVSVNLIYYIASSFKCLLCYPDCKGFPGIYVGIV